MEKKVMNIKKTKWFWTYFIAAGLLILCSIVLAPIWDHAGSWCFYKDWGRSIINLILAAMLLAYLFGYLLKKTIQVKRSTIKILSIVEFVILLLVALGCVLSQFKVINVSEPCQIFGLALWCRGIVEIFRAYYFRHEQGNQEKYPIWWLCVALFMVTFGTYCFAQPFINRLVLLWVFVVLIFALGAFCITLGILSKPSKK